MNENGLDDNVLNDNHQYDNHQYDNHLYDNKYSQFLLNQKQNNLPYYIVEGHPAFIVPAAPFSKRRFIFLRSIFIEAN